MAAPHFEAPGQAGESLSSESQALVHPDVLELMTLPTEPFLVTILTLKTWTPNA